MPPTRDFLIVGSGPGGYAAALTAARRGLRVGLIEREAWGGVCLNVGCIPTKALLAVSHLVRRLQQAKALGITVQGYTLDYHAIHARNERIISQLRRGILEVLQREGVELIPGAAAFEGPRELLVTHEGSSRRMDAERIILAVGARPSAGPWTFDERRLLSYRGLLALSTLPASLLIIGGGSIGCEFASCFSAFGTRVTLLEQQEQLLPAEDPEAVRWLLRRLEAQGVTILTGTTVRELAVEAEGVRATLSNGTTVHTAYGLIAIGQQPNVDAVRLSAASIACGRGITVDQFLRTSQPHIAAIGDCLEGHGLAHWASAEGVLAVRNLLEPTPVSLDPQAVPRCIFTDPEIASVGAQTSSPPDGTRVSRYAFGALGKSVCDEEPEGVVKLVVEEATDRLRGATIVGAGASHLIHLVVVAMAHGVTAKQLARTITAHPTLPESLSEAAAHLYGEALYVAAKPRSRTGRLPVV